MRRYASRLIAFLILVMALAACGGPAVMPAPAQPVAGLPSGTDGYPWWNDTVFYEVFVRSFYDSDGNGIGDLNGLTAKLDYLRDLGVTGLWLMPIHPAASYHGYDVTDYYAVNPDYGTLDDFKRLLAEAHRRGLRVILDLVLNHTSDRHPWFIAAQDPGSPYHGWYVWSQTNPDSSVWHPAASGYYYGFFWEGMPDLNYTNPAVTAQMEDVVRFWLQDVGVDGFRLDAAKFLIEEGSVRENSDSTHAWYRSFRPFYEKLNPQAVMVGEVWDTTPNAAAYAQGDQLDLTFDFSLAQAFIVSARTGRADEAAGTLAADVRLFRPGRFATFLTNHDQNRVMSQLAGDVDKAKAAATLLLTAPGVPFIYYGEEIGMLGKKPDEAIRTPMQWSAESNGGFTTGTPWEAVNADYAEKKNVADESADPNSLLSYYRRLIHLRDDHAALRVGQVFIVESGSPSVYAVLRASEHEAVLVVVNLGQESARDYGLSLESGPLTPGRTYRAAPLLGGGPLADLTAGPQGGFDSYKPAPSLPPHGSVILQLQAAK